MTPESALDRQIERYRAMTGEERILIALNLHKLSCDVAREGIRHQYPGASEAEIDQRLRERMQLLRS